jgi:hypothetical protein
LRFRRWRGAGIGIAKLLHPAPKMCPSISYVIANQVDRNLHQPGVDTTITPERMPSSERFDKAILGDRFCRIGIA